MMTSQLWHVITWISSSSGVGYDDSGSIITPERRNKQTKWLRRKEREQWRRRAREGGKAAEASAVIDKQNYYIRVTSSSQRSYHSGKRSLRNWLLSSFNCNIVHDWRLNARASRCASLATKCPSPLYSMALSTMRRTSLTNCWKV